MNAKAKEYDVKRSEMMTDSDEFGFKRQLAWLRALADLSRATAAFASASHQR